MRFQPEFPSPTCVGTGRAGRGRDAVCPRAMEDSRAISPGHATPPTPPLAKGGIQMTLRADAILQFGKWQKNRNAGRYELAGARDNGDGQVQILAQGRAG